LSVKVLIGYGIIMGLLIVHAFKVAIGFK